MRKLKKLRRRDNRKVGILERQIKSRNLGAEGIIQNENCASNSSLTCGCSEDKTEMKNLKNEIKLLNKKVTMIETLPVKQSLDRFTSFLPTLPKSCFEIFQLWPLHSQHKIYPDAAEKSRIPVLCDFETDGGGWTVIQKRSSGPIDEFYREWADYEQGFGSLDRNFWIGLKTFHALTKNRDQELRVDLWDFEGKHGFAKYSNFSISNASDDYRLSVGGYSGTAGDSLDFDNGMKFSTKDRDNDRHNSLSCANKNQGGWWYHACSFSNLNGLYIENKETRYISDTSIFCIYWKYTSPILRVEMKIRRRQ